MLYFTRDQALFPAYFQVIFVLFSGFWCLGGLCAVIYKRSGLISGLFPGYFQVIFGLFSGYVPGFGARPL